MFHNPQEAVRDFLLRCLPDDIPEKPAGGDFEELTRSSVIAVLRGLEDAAERLIHLLDQFDGDPDEELCITDEPHDDEGEAEPVLGWTNDHQQCGSTTDGELEPSLGWTAGGAHGTGNLMWNGYDLEESHDGREPEGYWS